MSLKSSSIGSRLVSWGIVVAMGLLGQSHFCDAKNSPTNPAASGLKLQAGTGKRPIFKKRDLFVGGKKIEVEIADSNEKRSHGLMFVENLPPDQGMLFIFDQEEFRSFWMKNTLVPLSIAYINKDLVITEILDMQPASVVEARPKSYPSKNAAMYALEMNVGWFEKNKIWPGAKIRFADNSREKLRH